LTLTLVGIVFAVVLITVQIGLFLGFAETTSGIIDHSQADLWIAAQGVKNLDAASPFSERKLYQVLGTPGVALAEKFIVSPAARKRPDGATETVEVVGFNPASSLGNPWNLIAGRISDLKAVGTVFIDELMRASNSLRACASFCRSISKSAQA